MFKKILTIVLAFIFVFVLGEIFDNCERAVKKMIVSNLIERVTISRGGKIEIKFNISLEQYLKFTGKLLETHSAK